MMAAVAYFLISLLSTCLKNDNIGVIHFGVMFHDFYVMTVRGLKLLVRFHSVGRNKIFIAVEEEGEADVPQGLRAGTGEARRVR